MHRCRPGGGHRAASWHPTIDKKVQRYALEQRILQMRKENEQLEKENVRLAAINLGFPRFGGQVDKGNAMTTRLLIDERPKPCTPAVHTAAEGGSPRVPWAAPDPAPRRTRGDAVWQIVRDPWRCRNHSGSPGSPLTAATTGDSSHLGACVLPAGLARRRLDQHGRTSCLVPDFQSALLDWGLEPPGDNTPDRDPSDRVKDRFFKRVVNEVGNGFAPNGPRYRTEGFPSQPPITWDLHIVSVGDV